jgi:hypothetical protein
MDFFDLFSGPEDGMNASWQKTMYSHKVKIDGLLKVNFSTISKKAPYVPLQLDKF